MTGLLNGVVTYFTETEKQMVSVERMDQYIKDVPEECQTESIQVHLLSVTLLLPHQSSKINILGRLFIYLLITYLPEEQ